MINKTKIEKVIYFLKISFGVIKKQWFFLCGMPI